MTGPETKILTGYGSLTQQHAKPGEVPPTTSGSVFILPDCHTILLNTPTDHMFIIICSVRDKKLVLGQRPENVSS